MCRKVQGAMAWPGMFQRGALLTRFSHHHVVVFLLTFFSYSLLHASRKTFSNVKVSISKEWTPSAWNTSAELPVEIMVKLEKRQEGKTQLTDTGRQLEGDTRRRLGVSEEEEMEKRIFSLRKPRQTWSSNQLFPSTEEATLFLGTLDTIFLFSYAVVFVFGTLTEWLHFYNKWFYCGLWIVNGLLQSTGWPCVVAVMGNWFGKAGSVEQQSDHFIIFMTQSQSKKKPRKPPQAPRKYAFLVTASVQFAGGIVIFFGLLVSPEEIGLPGIEGEENLEEDSHRPLINAENEDEYEPNYSIQEATAITQVNAISFGQACCLPGVILYSLAYACLKLVNYSFFFWLPFYLSNNFGWKEAEADKLSIWYDVGGIIGGTLQGFISDVLQKRAPVLALSLLLAVGSLVGYSRSPNNKSINALLMTVTGFFIGGPSNMISSAISADLGRQELIQGSSEALATVTGIVDGTGSIGAAVGQTSCTILFISPLIAREVASLVQRRQARVLSE
ncbi:Sugar phosphate exchanger 3 [Fukomys damarensis]|uniref:Sugar phosphate exchanger 3 n=1 Tax=Fukomys damarensis TaxID=885580 RepID=A0A091E4W1_FUKDA|nr:Sugar phosphate exchanger 3 [Fukomys damarensis]